MICWTDPLPLAFALSQLSSLPFLIESPATLHILGSYCHMISKELLYQCFPFGKHL